MKIIIESQFTEKVSHRPLISLYQYLDERIRKFSCNELSAKEYIYPTVISKSVIEKCGYFNNAPHFVFFLNSLHNDIYNYNKFVSEFDCTHNANSALKYFHQNDVDYCLPPTMCYHTYDQFSNKVLNDNFIVTSKGKAFRNESRYAQTMERLMDFTIRETVFFGDYRFVNQVKEKIMDFIFNLINELKLHGYCCSTNDMFFLSDQAQYKIKFQKQLKTKFEIRLYTRVSKSIAIGSINYHDSFFSKAFNIRIDNIKNVVSGCTGFGLERFVYAFICQHGMDPKSWPVKI